MSLVNEINGTVQLGGTFTSQSATNTVSFTGAMNIIQNINFTKIGRMGIIEIGIMQAVSTGSGGDVISSASIFPIGFEPAPVPYQDNPILGIYGLPITHSLDPITYNGYINIDSNGIMRIGPFITDSGGSQIGILQKISIPYITN